MTKHKRYRGGSILFNSPIQYTPVKTRKNQLLTPHTPIKPAGKTPLVRSNGKSVRNLTQFFEEQTIHPLEITYSHTQNNKPTISKKSNNQMPSNNNIRHFTMKKASPRLNNKRNTTVHLTNKLMPQKQIATATRKNNQQKQTSIFKVLEQPQMLKPIKSPHLKTPKKYINNIQRFTNIWTTQNAE